MNVAATAKRWLQFCDQSPDKAPHYYACEWRWRAEHFGQDQTIQSWTIRDETSLLAALGYLRKLLSVSVIPAVLTMKTEVGLLREQSHAGINEFAQLKARSALFALPTPQASRDRSSIRGETLVSKLSCDASLSMS